MAWEKRLGASAELMELFIPRAPLRLRRGSGNPGCASQNCTTLLENIDLLIPEGFGMLGKGRGGRPWIMWFLLGSNHPELAKGIGSSGFWEFGARDLDQGGIGGLGSSG